MDLERVEGLADVLGGGDLHHPHQPRLGVDVDGRPVGHEHEGDVGVALAIGVEAAGRLVVVFELSLHRLLEEELDRRQRSALGVQHLPAGERVRRRSGSPQHFLGDPAGSALDRGAGHPGLPGGRRGPGVADRGVSRQRPHLLHPELGPRDLLGDRHNALADLRGSGLDRGQGPAVGTPLEAHPGGGVVVVALGVGDVLEADREAAAAHHVAAGGHVAGTAG